MNANPRADSKFYEREVYRNASLRTLSDNTKRWGLADDVVSDKMKTASRPRLRNLLQSRRRRPRLRQ